jgi:hypothetical protein
MMRVIVIWKCGVVIEKAWASVPGRKKSSDDSRCGLARTRRVPLVGSDTSRWEGAVRNARVRSWTSGRMQRANVP